jgi:hypothetical protein
MKRIFKKIISWFRADDINNQLGLGCLFSTFRIVFVIGTIIFIICLFFK